MLFLTLPPGRWCSQPPLGIRSVFDEHGTHSRNQKEKETARGTCTPTRKHKKVENGTTHLDTRRRENAKTRKTKSRHARAVRTENAKTRKSENAKRHQTRKKTQKPKKHAKTRKSENAKRHQTRKKRKNQKKNANTRKSENAKRHQTRKKKKTVAKKRKVKNFEFLNFLIFSWFVVLRPFYHLLNLGMFDFSRSFLSLSYFRNF